MKKSKPSSSTYITAVCVQFGYDAPLKPDKKILLYLCFVFSDDLNDSGCQEWINSNYSVKLELW